MNTETKSRKSKMFRESLRMRSKRGKKPRSYRRKEKEDCKSFTALPIRLCRGLLLVSCLDKNHRNCLANKELVKLTFFTSRTQKMRIAMRTHSLIMRRRWGSVVVQG